MTLLTVFVGIIAFSNLVLLIGLAVLAVSIKKLVDTSVKPAINEAKLTIRNVNDLVDKVEVRAEHIMDISEDTVRQVSGKVVATTDIVQEGFASPFIKISSLLAGISRALEVWRRATVKP